MIKESSVGLSIVSVAWELLLWVRLILLPRNKNVLLSSGILRGSYRVFLTPGDWGKIFSLDPGIFCV